MDRTGQPCPDCEKGKLYPLGWWNKTETDLYNRWKCVECGCEESEN